jgi:hypothetical protein
MPFGIGPKGSFEVTPGPVSLCSASIFDVSEGTIMNAADERSSMRSVGSFECGGRGRDRHTFPRVDGVYAERLWGYVARLMNRVHFLHIPKTGGTALGTALGQLTQTSPIVFHGHFARLADIPIGENVILMVRDAICERFQ